MMGRQDPPQPSLFYAAINLDKRVRSNHPLRKVAKVIDFDFVSGEVENLYGQNGNVSVPPPVILKLIMLLVFYNVRSERELMDTLPERLDWLWFLGLDLDSEIPNHSVLSKARRRWGSELFRSFFERIVLQCVEAGLVDGKKVFVDASLVEANASKGSIVDLHSLEKYFNRAYRKLEERLESIEDDDRDDPSGSGGPPRKDVANSRHVSTTDPEASVMRKGAGKAKLSYQAHRALDGAYGVITQTLLGPGDENEAHRLMELLDGHHANTGLGAGTVVADRKYGTIDNFLDCDRRGIRGHMPPLVDTQVNKGRLKGIFPASAFIYRPQTDTLICPAGQTLTLRHRWENLQACEYAAKKEVCLACDCRAQCTRSRSSGRTVRRNFEQGKVDELYAVARSQPARRDLRIRQHFMERSFAVAIRYGFKRARWRGMDRVRIQDYMVAAVQNIRLLLNHAKLKPAATVNLGVGWGGKIKTTSLLARFFNLVPVQTIPV